MSDLADFLLARIAEDEEAVAEWEAKWGPLGGGWSSRRVVADDEYAQMIIDPARVLAECKAKRRIVEWYQRSYYLNGGAIIDTVCASASADAEGRRMEWACKLLALPYADHPDYQDEWRLVPVS